ncbi:seminase-like [Stomoxys calcitrans]|uniref:seminase-like n=1 Tax=Stomoxys calcitrans TaxID=35570 RepID=UPI0027E22A08|nr:seminase-like [Stomoxys calcitrans]
MLPKSTLKLLVIALLFHLSLVSGAKGKANKSKKKAARIVGGNVNVIRNYPYIVQLERNGNFFCGGTIISQRHILTAAHCIMNDRRPSDITVVAGVGRLGDTNSATRVTRRVSKIIKPRNFSLGDMNNDVAVLRTSAPLAGRNIRRIRLCRANIRQGMVMRVAGWGVTSENSITPSTRLRVIKVPVVSRATCRSQYSGVATLTGTMFCMSKPRRDACFGDSGGPAVRRGRVCGIVSFGNGCARRNFPGIYTRVTPLRRFINQGLSQ